MSVRTGILAVALACALPLLAVASAGATSYDDARSAASAAQDDMAAGRWSEANRRLSEALRACPDGRAGRGCRLLIEFNLAYLYQRWSDAAPDRAQPLLERSATLYRRILEEAPGHAETVTNLSLVLQALDDSRGLEALKQGLRGGDDEQASKVAMIIGDRHASRSEWRQAFDAYLEAVALAPAEEKPRRQAIDVYRRAEGAIESAALIGQLADWERRFPDVAAAGYRAILATEGVGERGAVERALLRWVSIASEQRVISSALVARQFAETTLPEIRELQRFLATLEKLPPERAPDPRNGLSSYGGDECLGGGDWWRATPWRRDVMAQAALAVGRAAIVAREPARAEGILTLAALCAPPMEEYVFGEMKPAAFTPLDIVTELAWLEFRFAELDPKGKKLASVIEQLFAGKSMAYEARDLEAIQRHHIVLGQIYAARGEWEGSGYRNATFQLSNAVRVAALRQRESGYYEPLPGIKALLGETYEKTGRKSEAQQIYVDAAQAYLDSDDLDRSDELLRRAINVAPLDQASATAVKLRATEQILETRKAVRQREETETPGATRPSIEVPEAGWLSSEAVAGLSADFLSRQKFKVNADLANVAGTERQTAEAARLADAALDSASAAGTLIGTSDLLRLERIGMLSGAKTNEARKVDIDYGEPGATDEPALRIKLPTAKTPAQVRLKD